MPTLVASASSVPWVVARALTSIVARKASASAAVPTDTVAAPVSVLAVVTFKIRQLFESLQELWQLFGLKHWHR